MRKEVPACKQKLINLCTSAEQQDNRVWSWNKSGWRENTHPCKQADTLTHTQADTQAHTPHTHK